MAMLADILPHVGRSSRLALDLYKLAATVQHEAAQDLTRSAKAVNTFGSILKQLATFIKEDDRVPSHEAIETLEDVIEQSRNVFSRIETITSINSNNDHDDRNVSPNGLPQLDWVGMADLGYLQAYLEALRATLAVMLQTMYTAQSVMWSKLEPTVSPQKVEDVVASEKCQLQTRVIEQQMAILIASKIHGQKSQNRYLMEANSSQSLIIANQEETPQLANLHWYQDKFIASLDISSSAETQWLPAVCSIAAPQSEMLLNRWTSLSQFDDRLRDAERAAMSEKRVSQQPMVESDDEDDIERGKKLAGNGARMASRNSKSDYIQPLFMEPEEAHVQKRDTNFGPTAPLSPAASPRSSRHHVDTAILDNDPPSSPRSSVGSIPVEATAAVEAKEDDDDVDLEIPWSLCTRKYYWKYIDSKIVDSNTEHSPSLAFSERNSWTEVTASWVCKEAIREAGYRYTQVQKDRRDGRRTRLETCFYIERPLQFHKIKQLVERTVELYRQKRPATPPPSHVRRSSFQRPPPPPLNVSHANDFDREKTPVPPKTSQPTLERTNTTILVPPPPPRLDRSLSSGAMAIPGYQNNQNPRSSNLQIPMPPPQYSSSLPQVQGPYSPSNVQGPYSPQLYNAPQGMFPQNGGINQAPPIPPHMQPHITRPHSPLRQSHTHSHGRSRYDDDYTTTDSDSGDRDRRRRHRSKSRSRHGTDKKKSHNKSKAAGALLGVGGLTALLDGLGGL